MAQSPIPSYSKVYTVGHAAIADLFAGPVNIEEKVDGSQFSFARLGGEVHYRSKGATIYPETVDNLFAPAVGHIESVARRLPEGLIFRGEALWRPKHNAICYDRVPQGYVVLFDVHTAGMEFLTPAERGEMAHFIGVEPVPVLRRHHTLSGPDALQGYLGHRSVLGGSLVEGVVVKPVSYNLFTGDGKVAMGKLVSAKFKEVQRTAWKQANPNAKDVVAALVESLRTEARWNKAVQHLREAGQLAREDRDIGGLIKEVHRDIEAECWDHIARTLTMWAIGHIKRGATRGLAEWYRDQLAQGAV